MWIDLHNSRVSLNCGHLMVHHWKNPNIVFDYVENLQNSQISTLLWNIVEILIIEFINIFFSIFQIQLELHPHTDWREIKAWIFMTIEWFPRMETLIIEHNKRKIRELIHCGVPRMNNIDYSSKYRPIVPWNRRLDKTKCI